MRTFIKYTFVVLAAIVLILFFAATASWAFPPSTIDAGEHGAVVVTAVSRTCERSDSAVLELDVNLDRRLSEQDWPWYVAERFPYFTRLGEGSINQTMTVELGLQDAQPGAYSTEITLYFQQIGEAPDVASQPTSLLIPECVASNASSTSSTSSSVTSLASSTPSQQASTTTVVRQSTALASSTVATPRFTG